MFQQAREEMEKQMNDHAFINKEMPNAHFGHQAFGVNASSAGVDMSAHYQALEI